MSRAVCPGSFDPVTLGHLDVVERVSKLFDHVVVAVGNNPQKNSLFAPVERVAMLREACAGWPGVSVDLFDGLLVDYCRQHDVQAIAKGLRSVSDFENELQMAQMNRQLAGIDTVFVPTAPQWSYVSSSLVREVAVLGGDVMSFLPAGLADRILQRARELRGG